MNNYKSKVYTLFFISILFLIFFLLLGSSTITCESEIISERYNSDEKSISMHSRVLYSISSSGEGFIRFYGLITDFNGVVYHLDRWQRFNYVKVSKNKYYKTTVIEESKSNQDDTDNSLLSYFFDIEGMNIKERRKIERISNDVLLFSDILNPSFICLIKK